MTEAQDSERLLADALRAQARSAPPAVPPEGTAPRTRPGENSAVPAPAVPPQYGLLSGPDAGSLEREHAALETPGAALPARSKPASGPLRAYWILLLAVLLGLLTGAVVGIVTLI
ncbi:hypothetical protein [Amycolatopsis taiwanensis]|uniref:Uncharacterized protein n=1 Tax=Amycolatopsis taiwanensis TaxID=342230 RepID=A0A9W6R0H7_9PSEU|nr:hypothetical protein [Amycolatopsis taiwanensis]GLY67346.1 hypothetical protein Atai01_39650 [Amycolatopsis taiwanensis]